MILWCLGYMQLSQAPDEPVYSMGLGYGFLSVILYCIWKENKILLLIALLFSVLVLFIASRGPLVAVLLYVCIKYLWYGSKGQKTAIIVCVIAFFLFILPYIKDLGSQEYIYSISRIAKGEFFTGDAGRLPIYSKIWDKVCLSPVIGYGIFGDRPFLNGAYVHNIFLEIVCNFGLLFGIFICLSMFWFIYKNIRQLSEQLKLFVFMFISSASIQLLVSGSYLTNMILPVVFGLIYNKKLLFVEK
jgi:hypothetical protein